MRKIYSLLFVLTLMGVHKMKAQVTVTGCTGAGNGSYTTLSAAVTAITASQASANIVISITGNTTEPAAGATLVNGSWTSLAIRPSGGSFTVSGPITAGKALLTFNGSDRVTIDGLNTGGNALTISNTTVSATTGTSTLKLTGDATSNTITNCTILGSANMAASVAGGNIWFSTGSTTGNDNNTVSNCNIGPVGTSLPSKAIFNLGSTVNTNVGNSGISITNNNIFDFFGDAVNSAGIYAGAGGNSWSITNNRFYQTGTRTWITGAQHSPIWINATNLTNGAQNSTITGNIIGYASNTQTGTYTLTGADGKFVGIYFAAPTSVGSSSVSSNTVASVSLSGVTSNGTGTASPFAAIVIANGVVTSDNNIIGSQAATGSLTFSTTSASGTEVYGMLNLGSNAWTSNDNQVGGITASNADATAAFIVYGMRAYTLPGIGWTATSNTIGGTVANSIQNNSLATTAQVIGMNTNAPAATLSLNTIRNLRAVGGTGTGTLASVIGIFSSGALSDQSISQNTIYKLSNTHATARTAVTGIDFTGNTSNYITQNFVYGLTVATTNAVAQVNGIRISGGNSTFSNNMIAVGAGISNAVNVNGISEAGGSNNIYHNSIYVNGSPTAGAGSSYAFNSSVTSSARDFEDNIFFNARSNAGSASGKNYAVKVEGTAPNPAGLTIDYNIYNVTGNGGTFGNFNSADVAGLAAWQTAVGQDANSISANPQFAAPENAIPNLHIGSNPTPVESTGTPLAAVTDDFDSEDRSLLTATDIGADAGNFTANAIMTYVSSTAVQESATACAGASVPVLRMEVVAIGAGVPLTLSSFTINGAGTSSFADVLSYRIYYTGTNSTFNTSNPITAATAGLSASNVLVTPSSTVTLESGTNYFWLVYNLASTISGASLDGQFTDVALSASSGGVPSVTSPAGAVALYNNPTASASSNTPVCANAVLNLAGGTNTGISFSWTGPNGFSSSVQNPSITNVTTAAAGTYFLTVTGPGGCVSPTTPVSAPVVINSTPAAPSTNNYSICFGSSIPSGQGLTSSSTGGAQVSGSQTIYFTVPAQPAELNDAPGTIAASANMAALPAFATVTSVVINYNNINVLGGSWQADVNLGLSGALDVAGAEDPAAGSTSGVFNYTRTVSSGITASITGGTVNLLYWDFSDDNGGDEATFPTGTSVASVTVNYTYPDPGNILWYKTVTGGSSIGSGSPFNPIGVDPALPNSNTAGDFTYYAQVPNGACPSARTAAILTIGSQLTAAATADPATALCPGESATITAVPTGGEPTYTYSWKQGATEISTNESFSVTPPVTTTYQLTITDECSQTANASVTIVVNAPSAVLSGSTSVCQGGSANLQVAVTGGTAPYTVVYSDGTSNFTVENYNSNDNIPVTPAANTTYSLVSATSASGCAATSIAGAATVTIKVNAAIASVTAGTNPLCSGNTTTLTANGVAGTNAIVNWYSQTGGTGTNFGTGLTLPNRGAGTYYALVSGDCGTAEASITITSKLNSAITSVTAGTNPLCSGHTTTLTANGVAGTNAIVNWYSQTGGAGTNHGSGLTLPNRGAGTYYARVSGDCGTAEAFITVTSGNNTFSGTGNWTDNTKWSCGTVPGSSDPVTIGAGAQLTLNTDFTVSNTFTMSSGSSMDVAAGKTITVAGGGTANFNGQLVTFKSNSSGTAALGQVQGTLSGATNVTVERYIPNNGFRSWRLLSVPTFGSGQTIRQAWQEGDANQLPLQNNLPNYGMQITGTGTRTAAQALGFDDAASSPALLTWTGSVWAGAAGTNTAIANNKAYFVFIRGERSKGISGAISNTSATTLRTNGSVYTGDQTVSIGAASFGLVPNLYPSAIDFTGLTRTGGVSNLFYIWDSKKKSGSSLGVYQTFSATNGFNCTIGGGSYTLGQPNTTIESGQAFFVQSTTAGSVVLKESAKISGGGSLGFRPAALPAKIDSRLFGDNDEMLDANVVVFDANYNNAVDADDAPKFGNPGANFAIEKSGKLLAIEGAQPVAHNDVVQFRMWNLQQQAYKFEFAAGNFTANGLTAMLEDDYLHTSTVLDLNSTTSVKFNVDNNAASAAANRFRVVFKQAAPLPISFVSIAGNRHAGGVKVSWKVAAERNIHHYQVERSVDGTQFTAAGTVNATGGNGETSYNFNDQQAPASIVYYRIKSNGSSGEINYSSTVKVTAAITKAAYSIAPNPVENGIVHLHINNQPAGKYAVRILTAEGETILRTSIVHPGGSSRQMLDLPLSVSRGTYQVEITGPGQVKSVQTLFVNKK